MAQLGLFTEGLIRKDEKNGVECNRYDVGSQRQCRDRDIGIIRYAQVHTE